MGKDKVTEEYGSLLFTDAVMQERLPKPTYKELKQVIEEGKKLDLSIANENLWLETDALGLGGVWLGIAPIEERMHEVESVLQMPAGHHAFAIFALGYPAESKPQQDRFDPARIHYAE